MSLEETATHPELGGRRFGRLPSHWQIVQLRRVLDGIKDGTHGTFERVADGVPLLSAKNVFNGRISVNDSESQISKQDAADITRNGYPQAGDVLLTIVGSIGRSVVYELPCSMAFQRSVAFLRPNRKVIPKYLQYYFEMPSTTEDLLLRSKASAQSGIYLGDLVATQLPLPPISEQRAIVAFLDRKTSHIDALIEKKHQLIELLQEERVAVISHAVTQGLNRSAARKSSAVTWLGDIPAHWNVTPFKRLAHFLEGPGILAVDFRDEGVPLLRVSSVSSSEATLHGCNYLDPEMVAKKWSKFRVSEGDLLISASATMGTVTQVGPDVAGAVPYTGIIRLRPVDGRCNRDYLKWFVVSAPFLAQIDVQKAGSTIQHYGPAHLNEMVMTEPPIEEQSRIAAYVEDEVAKFAQLRRIAELALERLHELRASLVTSAVTGQIDVREAA